MIPLQRPTLLIDESKCRNNILRMKQKADRLGVIFRPHFKTHQSAAVGEWFREIGVTGITVSSVTMAAYFAGHEWDDITIAFPVNFAEIDNLNSLAARISLNVQIECKSAMQFLNNKLRIPAGVFIKIDTGNHRTGIPVEDHEAILELTDMAIRSKYHSFKGFIVHEGNTYHAKDIAEIRRIHEDTVEKLLSLKSFMSEHGFHGMMSTGDTPTLSLADDFRGVDEVRPGNFVFYDIQQQSLGSCNYGDIAIALACPVVATHPDRNEVVIYGGAIHLSKDFITSPEGNKIFARVVELREGGWGEPLPGTYVKSLSQEHGIIRVGHGHIHRFKLGKFIGILPAHTCLTVHHMKEYYTFSGRKITTYLSC